MRRFAPETFLTLFSGNFWREDAYGDLISASLGICENTTPEAASPTNIYQTEALAEKNRLTCDGSPLEEEEADLVAMYRILPDHKKEDAFDIIYTLYQKHVERKKASIYWTYAEERESAKSDPTEGLEAQDGTA